MFKRVILLFVVTMFSSQIFAQAEGEADAVIGKWLTESKKAHVEIFKEGDKFNGKIVWLKEPLDPDTGMPKLDKENPEDELKTKPLLGLNLIKGFEYDEDNVWEDGEIYDPENGKTYSCKMTLAEDGKTLEVRGFIGFSFIGRTQVWTRIAE